MTKTRIGLVIVTGVFVGALVCGCQEEQASSPGVSDVKGNRLIGAENVQLKGQIETLKKQVEALQGQIESHKGLVEQQKQQTIKCEQQIKDILIQSEQEKQQQKAQFEQDKQQQKAQFEQEKQRQSTRFEQEKQQQIAQLQQAGQADLKACEDKSVEMLAASAENMQGLTAEIAALKAELEKIKGKNKAKK